MTLKSIRNTSIYVVERLYHLTVNMLYARIALFMYSPCVKTNYLFLLHKQPEQRWCYNINHKPSCPTSLLSARYILLHSC